MPFAIEAQALTRVFAASNKRAAIRAVDGVDLRIEQGEVLALLGPNGAGKTTIVRLLACLLRPTAGTARVGGHDIRQHPDQVRALCGVSTENPGLYERLTATEYLTFFARLYCVPDALVPSTVQAQLQAAGLSDRRDDRTATFSKGMRQRLNIARAVLHRPRVVFLDEPTSGLDVEAALAVRQHIQDMSRDAETTFLICTHNLPEAERLATRIAVMNSGRIVAAGAPDELKCRLAGACVVRVRLRQALPLHRQAASSVPGVERADLDADQLVINITAPEETVCPVIVRRLVEAGADVISLSRDTRSLEDVYLHLVHEETQPEAPP